MSGSMLEGARRLGTVLGVGVLAAGLLGFTPASDARDVPQVGETDLYNLTHVGNYNFDANEAADGANDHGAGQQGTDLEFFSTEVDGELRDFAVVGGYTRGAYIFDITDPEANGGEPVLANFVACAQPRNDVGVHQFENADGTTTTWIGLSLQRGRVCEEAGSIVGNKPGDGGFALFDVSDPYADEVGLGRVQVGYGGVHNLVFHPTEQLAYVWNGALPGGRNSVPIVDLRDLSKITVAKGPETLGGPHDGELSPDGSLLYVASENNYEIFDNTDPVNPVRIGAFAPNPGTYAHGYFPTPDGSVSITNNESLALGGFFAPNSGVCPGEGLGFYDTSNPAAPIGPIGYFAPPVQGQTDDRACTSHFGRVVPNGKVMTVGWYILGARVVDFSDPTQPREIGAAAFAKDEANPSDNGSEAWSAKAYKGPYLYVGDQGRGFDIFRWSGPVCPEGHEAAGASPFEDGWTADCVPDGRRSLVEPSSRVATDPRELELRVVGAPTGRFSCQLG